MNKSELVAAIAEEAGISKAAAEKAVAAFTNSVVNALKKGDKVSLVGFGTFEVVQRAARTARNPRTQETIQVPASKAPRFKPGKAFKEAVK